MVASRPHLVDNDPSGREHGEALAYLVDDHDVRYPLAVATGYVNLDGLHHLASVADGRGTRLLIGAEPHAGLGAVVPMTVFEAHRHALRAERDLSRFPPSRAARKLLAVEAWIDRLEVRIRRYVDRFLHGKAYLLGDAHDAHDARVALVMSANLTGAGLHANLELGLTDYTPAVAGQAVTWFDRLWDGAVDYEDDLRALLFPDPGLIDPPTVYLRALLELQPPDLDEPGRATRPTGLELAPFQRDGYERARVIAQRHGGVIYADGVGTGKTEIGLAFIEERTKEDGVYALVIAPAQLAKRWRERIEVAKLPATVISFNDLASDEQLVARGTGGRRVLPVTKDSYRLVLVDEAHALRNEDTTWYRSMERLLGGTRKEIVLLTATPINNGLWDLYNLVMLFARHDRGLSSAGIDSIAGLFRSAGANERDPENLDPDALFPLADAVSVRRDRAFIPAPAPPKRRSSARLGSRCSWCPRRRRCPGRGFGFGRRRCGRDRRRRLRAEDDERAARLRARCGGRGEQRDGGGNGGGSQRSEHARPVGAALRGLELAAPARRREQAMWCAISTSAGTGRTSRLARWRGGCPGPRSTRRPHPSRRQPCPAARLPAAGSATGRRSSEAHSARCASG